MHKILIYIKSFPIINQVIFLNPNVKFDKFVMKKLIVLITAMFLSLPVFSQTVAADAVLGTWLTASGKVKVMIYKEGNVYNGKIVWLKNPTYEDGKVKVDKNNPDKAKQSAPLLGLNMLKGFVFDDGEWEDGTIYDPENGKTYSCTIKFRRGMLDLRGYIGISLIGRTQTWYKIPDSK
jgi:uncharacterized protein (DUF2147 family)